VINAYKAIASLLCSMSLPYGIQNSGCICFATSIIQQLYMIPSFRLQLLESDNFLSLRSIFLLLDRRDDNAAAVQSIDINGYLDDLSNDIGIPLSIDSQQDAYHFLIHLMSCSIKKIDTLTSMYLGSLSNVIAAVDDPSKRLTKLSQFSSLSLDIKGCKTLSEALDLYSREVPLQFPWSVSEGNPSQRVALPSTKTTIITQFPEHLIIHLKRFDLDLKTREVVKRNHRFEFPLVLDVSTWQRSTSTDVTMPIIYEVSGLVVHNGTASSGHYYSIIRKRCYDMARWSGADWYLFDDEVVVPFDSNEDLENEAYGCDSDDKTGRNAIMLVYDRV
jgi:ubiquitin carboxyl-terminal hydrolase 34